MRFLAKCIMSETKFEIILILKIWWLKIIPVEKESVPGHVNEAYSTV
jgi:hypothetical protein